jgi:hypothetical protein
MQQPRESAQQSGVTPEGRTALTVTEADLASPLFADEGAELARLFGAWKERLADYAVDRPAESLAAVVGGATLIFYLAERGRNPEVRTVVDAFHYISTCLSVGYARIFPQTQLGKLVAAMVMIVGPGLTAWLVEGRLAQRTTPAVPTMPLLEPAAR